MPALDKHDAHRPNKHSPDQLARICAMHHQRQFNAHLVCQFEGSQIWVTPGQSHAPAGRARVDIAQHGGGRLELLYRGKALRYTRHELFEHLRHSKLADDKGVNSRVDALAKEAAKEVAKASPSKSKERRRVGKLKAELALQEQMRQQGIYQPQTHVSAPLMARAGKACQSEHAAGPSPLDRCSMQQPRLAPPLRVWLSFCFVTHHAKI